MTGQQASACKSCYQIPWALSALAIGFHINGVSGELKLSPAVLSEIYLGRIKVCNDSRITSLNPGLHLPALKITPIYAAATGDTYVFTSYLSAVDSTWKRQVGAGPSVSVPTGTLANGNAGESTNGAIAYVGAAYLIAHQLPAAAIENAAGNYVHPNLGNIEAAAKTIKKVTRNALHISNPPRSARRVLDLDVRIRRGAVERDPEEAVEGLASVRVASGTGVRPPPHYAAIPSVVLRASIAAVNRFGA
jgi:phosphate transport system substrate-binding protein